MKFYVIQRKGDPLTHLGIFTSPALAMAVLATQVADKTDCYVQEYEGWSTCQRWKYGDKVMEER